MGKDCKIRVEWVPEAYRDIQNNNDLKNPVDIRESKTNRRVGKSVESNSKKCDK